MEHKVWVCGQVGENHWKEITELAKVFKYFDGMVWCVNYNRKVTESACSIEWFLKDVLDKERLAGEVFGARWVNLHDVAPTQIMQSGHFKTGDWICFLDAPELLKEDFAKDIKNKVKEWDAQGITAVGWNRIQIFKWNPQIIFVGSPHQGPVNLTPGKFLNLADETKVKYNEDGTVHFGDFILNTRKLDNSHIINPTKYTFCYNISNQLQLFYQNEDFQRHEERRRHFIEWFRENVGDNTLENLEKFMREALNEDIIVYFDFEPIYRDFYRLKVLKTPLMEILATRNDKKMADYMKPLW